MKVAVLPGDGIGPEIIAQALRVLKKLKLGIEFQEAPVGGAGYAAHGDPLPEKTLALAKEADAILFGAVGDPRYDTLARAPSARNRQSSACARRSACSPTCARHRSIRNLPPHRR